eukprot:5689515-Amphidinium_carterae.2
MAIPKHPMYAEVLATKPQRAQHATNPWLGSREDDLNDIWIASSCCRSHQAAIKTSLVQLLLTE